MKNHAAQVVSDEKFASRHKHFPEDTPNTKEAYYIREIFDGEFSSLCEIIF
jgi:asparagine synthase (glutamine-hydrolysing)